MVFKKKDSDDVFISLSQPNVSDDALISYVCSEALQTISLKYFISSQMVIFNVIVFFRLWGTEIANIKFQIQTKDASLTFLDSTFSFSLSNLPTSMSFLILLMKSV